MKARHATTAPALCPYCAATLNAWGAAHGLTPSPGDGTFCVYCAALLIYDPNMRPRKPTGSERAEWMADPDVQKQAADLQRAVALGKFPIGKPD